MISREQLGVSLLMVIQRSSSVSERCCNYRSNKMHCSVRSNLYKYENSKEIRKFYVECRFFISRCFRPHIQATFSGTIMKYLFFLYEAVPKKIDCGAIEAFSLSGLYRTVLVCLILR